MKGEMNRQEYDSLVKQRSPKSSIIKDTILAFVIGGIICTIGQLINNGFSAAGLGKVDASAMTSASMIFLGALLTGLNLYEKIAKYGGAGTLVPITGFANSIVSPAIEYKTEGYVLGVGAKMFIIAGPVLVYGISASIIYGVIYYLINRGGF